MTALSHGAYAIGEEPIRVRNAREWTDGPEVFTEVDEWTEFELEFPSGVVRPRSRSSRLSEASASSELWWRH